MASSNSTRNELSGTAFPKAADLLRVWLVDDHDGFRQPLAKLLNLEPGVECARHFSSAEAALLALQEQSPDVILLDVEMPGMSGVEALQPIKRLAPSTSVLMLTALASKEVKERSLAAGAVDFVFKDFTPKEIVAAIRATRLPQDSGPRP